MNEPTIDNVVQRMDRLERENRRMKLVGVLVLLGIAAVIVMGQAKATKVAKVIEAEQFVLRDENGRERATLQTILDATFMTLRNSDAKVTSSLFAAKDLAGIEIQRQNGSRLALYSKPVDAGLYIDDNNKKTRASITITGKERSPAIGILDKHGNVLMLLRDVNGSGIMSLYRHGDKVSGLAFIESDGSSRIDLMSSKDDPSINFYDKYGTKRAALGLKKGTPLVVLADEQGKVVWGKTGNR